MYSDLGCIKPNVTFLQQWSTMKSSGDALKGDTIVEGSWFTTPQEADVGALNVKNKSPLPPKMENK